MNTDQRRLETTNLSFIDRCSWALIGSQIAFSAPCHESNPQASQNATEGANASSLARSSAPAFVSTQIARH
jgi:hypothetical protein